ncbi:GAF domain-containing sensor histidine kinase [Spirosoma pulveris]
MHAANLNELDRLANLGYYNILDSLPEQQYDDITYLAAMLCGMPISLISFIDEKRQWFKSRFGYSLSETSRQLSFCAHAIQNPHEMMVVSDATQDERFSLNPLIWQDPKVVFYAGVPLVTEEGYALGTLCVIDNKPNNLSDGQAKALVALARQVMALLVLRKRNREMELSQTKERESHALRAQFVSMVSHEFRNPLTSIGLSSDSIDMYAEFLDEKVGIPIKRHLQSIHDQIKNLTKLMNSVLSFSKGEAGKIYFSPEMVDVVCWSQDLVALHFTGRPDKREVSIRYKGKVKPVNLDPDLMAYVVINLLSNAFKFSQTNPELLFCFKSSQLTIQVVDQGIGIPKKELPQLTNPFYRASNATKIEGTGLGLSIARQFIEVHGGALQIESQQNKGTTCTIHIPIK